MTVTRITTSKGPIPVTLAFLRGLGWEGGDPYHEGGDRIPRTGNIYIYIYTHGCTYTDEYMYIYIYMLHAFLIFFWSRLYVCMYVCMYVCLF